MSRLVHHYGLLELLIYVQVSLFLATFVTIAVVSLSFLVVISLSFLWGYLCAFLIFKVASLLLRFLVIIATITCVVPRPIQGSDIKENIEGQKQENVKLEPRKLLSMCESDQVKGDEEDEDDITLTRTGRTRLSGYMMENSWKIPLPNATLKEEQTKFYQMLSFWRKKERGAK